MSDDIIYVRVSLQVQLLQTIMKEFFKKVNEILVDFNIDDPMLIKDGVIISAQEANTLHDFWVMLEGHCVTTDKNEAYALYTQTSKKLLKVIDIKGVKGTFLIEMNTNGDIAAN